MPPPERSTPPSCRRSPADTTPSIRALALSGTSVVVGGTFTMAGGMAHQNLAAVDATTGAVVGTFTGTADGRVAALAVAGADLIAAGEFVTIGGLARTGVARLDAATGAAIAGFDAQSNGNVSSVVVSGANVFVGGAFAQMGGASRSRLAQIAAATGVATTWNPGANADRRADGPGRLGAGRGRPVHPSRRRGAAASGRARHDGHDQRRAVMEPLARQQCRHAARGRRGLRLRGWLLPLLRGRAAPERGGHRSREPATSCRGIPVPTAGCGRSISPAARSTSAATSRRSAASRGTTLRRSTV